MEDNYFDTLRRLAPTSEKKKKVEYFNMFGELYEYHYQYGMETHIHEMKMNAHNRVLEREKWWSSKKIYNQHISDSTRQQRHL